MMMMIKKKNILDSVSKKEAQISSFIKISPVGAEVFHVDGRSY
jgi:hypothetical protein